MAIYATQFVGFLVDYLAKNIWLYSSGNRVIWSVTIHARYIRHKSYKLAIYWLYSSQLYSQIYVALYLRAT